MKIDFKDLGGPVYTGRPRGVAIRQRLGLDAVDKDNEQVVDVAVPDSTYSMTSSFFLGLFGPSVVHAGSSSAFFEKFHFTAKPALKNAFTGYVENALQAKRLFN
ncbi:MAG: hypothetical protein C0490_28485 [Marivirga sp.]|nr:hypothetical protein [Marivirga sp.]